MIRSVRIRKHRQLFKLQHEKGDIQVAAQVNLSTMKVTILTTFKQGSKGWFKGVRYPAEPVERGMCRHHIAYHFDNPMNGTVLMKRGLHRQVHTTRRLEW